MGGLCLCMSVAWVRMFGSFVVVCIVRTWDGFDLVWGCRLNCGCGVGVGSLVYHYWLFKAFYGNGCGGGGGYWRSGR